MQIITCNKNEIKINSYIIKTNDHAIVIDPNNFEEIVLALGSSKLDYIFLTHEHFDHIIAVDKLREKYTAKVIAQEHANKNIQKSSRNLSKYSNIILDFMKVKTKNPIEEFSIKPADIVFDDTFGLTWQNKKFFFKHTPGHSKGSCCILVNNSLFVGDSLFDICETDTKGLGASKKEYENVTLPFFKGLDPSLKVFAGHYSSFILGDKLERY